MNKTWKVALIEAYDKGYQDGIIASRDTDINWEEQNKLRQQWILDNPDAEYEGWMSI